MSRVNRASRRAVRPVFGLARQSDWRAVESLKTGAEHRAVGLVEQSLRDVHDAVGVDAEGVAGEREVVDRAEREPVDDRGDALRRDVGGLYERALAQIAQRWRWARMTSSFQRCWCRRTRISARLSRTIGRRGRCSRAARSPRSATKALA